MIPNNQFKKAPVKSSEPEQTSFQKLQLLLQFLEYDTLLIPVKEDNPVEQLFISSDTSDEEKSFMLQLSYVNDMVKAANINTLNEEVDKDTTYYLQFFSTYLVQVKEEKQLEMYLLMSVFNRLLTVGTFDFTDDGITYRYCLANSGREIDSKVIVELINMMQYFFQEFGKRLVDFATNDKKLSETVEELEQVLGKAVNPNIG